MKAGNIFFQMQDKMTSKNAVSALKGFYKVRGQRMQRLNKVIIGAAMSSIEENKNPLTFHRPVSWSSILIGKLH